MDLRAHASLAELAPYPPLDNRTDLGKGKGFAAAGDSFGEHFQKTIGEHSVGGPRGGDGGLVLGGRHQQGRADLGQCVEGLVLDDGAQFITLKLRYSLTGEAAVENEKHAFARKIFLH